MAVTDPNPDIETFTELYDRYYRDKIARLMQSDETTLHVEYADLFRVDADVADRWLEQPSKLQATAEEALRTWDGLEAVDATPTAAVRLTDSEEYLDRRRLGELSYNDDGTGSDLGSYVALQCQLGKVGEREPMLDEAAFECQRCGTLTYIPQSKRATETPHECQGCERQGPFSVNDEKSTWQNVRKLRLEAPPEEQSGEELTAYALGDVADAVDDFHSMAGSRVTVLGKLEADMSDILDSRGRDEPIPDVFFNPEVFIWDDGDQTDINVDDYREEIQEYASRDDAVELFARNIDPSLVVTEQWEAPILMATAWLFAAPRIDPDGVGSTVRGDIHMLFVSDPGMNKSAFAEKLAEISPQCSVKDAEGMSSEVGLTAAGVQGDGFGNDGWSVEPKAFPKANGGQLILEEFDKGPTPDFLNGIHGLLEGDQTLSVEKGGAEATLATRVGFLTLGNPMDGSFDPMEPITEQFDLHDALMSRFDLIATMVDQPDEETDEQVAEGVLDGIDESARLQYGDLSPAETDSVAGEVPRDVLQAWVQLAWDEVHPMLSDAARDRLKEFYVETRDLNDSETAPVTARTLAAGWRVACAFARVELSETIEERHAERAIELSKQVVGLNFDPGTGEFDANRTTETPSSQHERRKGIQEAIRSEQKTPATIAAETGLDEQQVRDELDSLLNSGKVIQPTNGEFRAV